MSKKTPEPTDLSETDLDRATGGGMLLPAVQQAHERPRPKSVVLQFDEADALKQSPNTNRVVASGGGNDI